LHEACTGGHLETLLQLVRYTKDLDHPDSHGQTAAHIAAYHGETGCLNTLIDNGCDVNYQDNQMCLPAHLAVKKNYPETLQ
jgi:ankyrin repeat protein